MSKFAIVFAGQGSQSVGMMAGFVDMPVVQRTFEEASDILKVNLWQMMVEGPAEVQNQTINTQPLMLTAGVATYRAWLEKNGATAAYFAGHSLGEYTALVAAESLTFADALPLVRYRAQAMQDAVPEGTGGIAAVLGLDVELVRAVCRDAAQGEVLDAVNLNSPGQIVIAGHKTAVERGMLLAKERGAKRALLLPMSVPSHCALMQDAALKLAQALKHVPISAPKIRVVHNVLADVVSDLNGIGDALVAQLYSRVRWIESVQKLRSLGATRALECGPGKALSGMVKRIDSDLPCAPIGTSVEFVTQLG